MAIKKKRKDCRREKNQWTVFPFGVVTRDGKEVYNPYPPSQRVRMAKINNAWRIKDPEKQARELVKLGIYPESALDEFKD